MRRSLLAFLAPLLAGGTCGSVLRVHAPEGWPRNADGTAYERTFGDVQVELLGLVSQNRSLDLTLTARGQTAIELRGVELQVAGESEVWVPGTGSLLLEPGQPVTMTAVFSREVTERACRVVLRLSSGDIVIDLAQP